MSQDRCQLEPKYEPGRSYLVPGTLLNEIIRTVRRMTPVAGDNVELTQTPQGILINASGGGSAGTSVSGPFWDVYADGGSWMLRGGVVYATENSETVADFAIGSIASPPADNVYEWLKVNVRANEADGVLLPGCEITSVSKGGASSIPSNDTPTEASPTGYIYISLGSWLDGRFRPSGVGDVSIFHCPGQLSFSRV